MLILRKEKPCENMVLVATTIFKLYSHFYKFSQNMKFKNFLATTNINYDENDWLARISIF